MESPTILWDFSFFCDSPSKTIKKTPALLPADTAKVRSISALFFNLPKAKSKTVEIDEGLRYPVNRIQTARICHEI